MYLGIEHGTELVYEGSSGPVARSSPQPVVVQAKLIEKLEDWTDLPRGLSSSPFHWLLRETSFDPVTRIRRGAIYQAGSGAQPVEHKVLHPFDADPALELNQFNTRSTRLFSYSTCYDLLNRQRQGRGLSMVLGSGLATSVWTILDVEMLATQVVLVTLKSQATFGVLPILNERSVPVTARVDVRRSYDKVLDCAFKESPSSVVEHCRDALQVITSRWLVAQDAPENVLHKELAELVKVLEREPHSKVCAANLARVVARLHGRGKSNEREKTGSGELVPADAELALNAVGFTLREFGWAT